MPEGPEIRKSADDIGNIVCGHNVSVTFGLDRLKVFESLLRDRKVVKVTSRGKALLTYFDNGFVMLTHNQLYGIWFCLPVNEFPDTQRQLRVRIATPHMHALLYSASTIDVLPETDLQRHPFISKLGPDVLDNETDPILIAERLEQARWRNKTLGTLLLDQGFIAGLGNYLRSEILFFSRLSYQQRPRDLSDNERLNLATCIKQVATRSYRNNFITLPDDVLQKQQQRYDSYESYRFAVFGRDNEACVKCSSKIRRVETQGRRLYYCVECQSVTE